MGQYWPVIFFTPDNRGHSISFAGADGFLRLLSWGRAIMFSLPHSFPRTHMPTWDEGMRRLNFAFVKSWLSSQPQFKRAAGL